MAGTIIADTWQNGDGTQNYKCRAWVNFNGTGTVAIRASGNVSSITDNGTGDYSINFITAMPDTYYSGSGNNQMTLDSTVNFDVDSRPYITAATYQRIKLGYSASSVVDSALMQYQIFR